MALIFLALGRGPGTETRKVRERGEERQGETRGGRSGLAKRERQIRRETERQKDNESERKVNRQKTESEE